MDATRDMPIGPLPTTDEAPDERRFWRKVERTLARLPFVEDLLAAYYCALDRDTPAHVRGVLLGALAYFVLPADLIPDLLAGLGFTDDAAVLAAALTAVGRHITASHRRRARLALGRMGR